MKSDYEKGELEMKDFSGFWNIVRDLLCIMIFFT